MFPDQVGGCEKNFSLLRSKCICAINGNDLSQDGQSEHLIKRADEYVAWAKEDSKLVGIVPWHYGNRPSSTHTTRRRLAGPSIATGPTAAPFASPATTPDMISPPSYVNPGMDYGAAQYPRFVAHLLGLGWVNVSQMMPAELCGLV